MAKACITWQLTQDITLLNSLPYYSGKLFFHHKKTKMRQIYPVLLCLMLFAVSAKAQDIFTDNYAPGVTFVDFGGSTNSISVDGTVAQSGTSSFKAIVPTGGYTGGAFSNSTPLNLTAYNCVSFWVRASQSATLNVAGLGNNGISNAFFTEYLNIPVTTSWTKVIIPIPDPAKLTSETGMFHWAEGSDEGGYTLWFDNIKYENLNSSIIGSPTAAFATETINRGIGDTFSPNGVTCTFPVNSVNQTLIISKLYFTFTSSNTAVATFNNATATGTAVGAGTANITAVMGATVAGGVLTVNVAAASDPTTAAPAPTENAANVISLFSNAYTNVPVDTWSAVWDAADVADVQVAGNDNKRYTNLVFCGVEFTSSPIDATNMDFYHVDIWTPNATFFNIKLVDFGANGVFGGGDDTESELPFTPTLNDWVSLDIPLSSFTGLASRAHLAQMLYVSSTSKVYVDNVYFYKVASLPTASISGSATVCRNAASPNVTFTGANGTAPYTFTYKINGGANNTVTTTSGNSVNVAAPTGVAGTFVYSLVSVSDATSSSQAQTGTATIVVNALPTATISASGSTTNVCPGRTVTLTSSVGTSYLWNTGATTRSIVVSAAGSYNVRVTNSNGCNATSSNTVVTYLTCAKPTGLASSNITSTSARLAWTPVTCAVGYQYEIRRGTSGAYTAAQTTGTSRTVTGLLPSSVYQWRVITACKITPDTITSNGYSTVATFNTPSAPSSVAGTKNINIHPNPSNGNFQVYIQAMNKTDKAVITISNLMGKPLATYIAHNNNGEIKMQIVNNQLPGGAYMLSYQVGQETGNLILNINQ